MTKFFSLSKHFLALVLVLLMVFPSLAEEIGDDDEIVLEDIIELEPVDEENLTDIPWTFPVALEDMDPVMIRLANKECLLSKKDVPDPLVTMKTRKAAKDGSNANGGVRKASGGEMKLQKTCADALVTMFEEAAAEDIILYLKSAYRSYQTQNTMYYNRLKKNNGKDDGWVSKPGASDHQTGLGCDVVPRSWRDKSMNSTMIETKECQWMAEHCAEYGFIIRYPADKEEVTEINYEPWHLRYVGIPVATYIMENGLCLEEFHQELQAAIDEYLFMGGDPSVTEPYIQVSHEND